MTMRWALCGGLLLALSATAEANDARFAGWSADGTFYAFVTPTCGDAARKLCGTGEARPTWPAVYGAPDANDGCIEDNDALQVLDFDAFDALVKPATPSAKGPGGATVKLVVDRQGAGVLTFTAGKKKVTADIADIPGGKVKAVYWRADGKRAAVVIEWRLGRSSCDQMTDATVREVDVSALGLAEAAARQASTVANTRGMKSLQDHVWSDARSAFREAIQADATFPLPHYNLACVASITGDLTTARTELAWLAASDDKAAKALLAKAAKDRDLDAASIDPGVRQILGLPAYGDLDARARLVERGGAWSIEGADCESPFVTIAVSGKKVKATIVTECQGERTSKSAAGTIGPGSGGDGTLVLTLKRPSELASWPQDLPIVWEACKGTQVDASCFRLGGAEGPGPFHRGAPEVTMGFK
jgi:hypothetical protein